jgi:hypothetical protein
MYESSVPQKAHGREGAVFFIKFPHCKMYRHRKDSPVISKIHGDNDVNSLVITGCVFYREIMIYWQETNGSFNKNMEFHPSKIMKTLHIKRFQKKTREFTRKMWFNGQGNRIFGFFVVNLNVRFALTEY